MLLLTLVASGATASAASAEPVAYELTGEWSSPPAAARSGVDVLGAVWRFDVNDDGPAPSNDPVPNNVLTVTLAQATFTRIPPTCVVDGQDAEGNAVDPVSSLSADGRVLTCNVGTRPQGTAQLALTGIVADGPAGALVEASASFLGLQATLPPIPITATFAMDAKFNGGSPATAIDPVDGNSADLSFPFSLSHANGSPAGPSTVTYTLTMTNSLSPQVEVRGTGCIAQDRRQSGYPFSADARPAQQTAPFPSCTLTKVGATRFELTVSDLDYAAATPSLDSNGQPLPAGMDVIAAGELTLRVNTVPAGTYTRLSSNVTLQAATITYTAVDGQTSTDQTANNTNSVPIVRGAWTHQWALNSQRPATFPGASWQATWRAPAGATVMSVAALGAPPTQAVAAAWMCTVIDAEYAEFQDARVVMKAGDAPYYDDSEGTYPVWYYTGEMVDPVSNDPVDPNLFACGTTTSKTDPAAGNQPGWSTTPPADLSTVKAVKLQITYDMGSAAQMPYNLVYFAVDQRIKPDVQAGQDIWTWTSFLTGGQDDWAWTADRKATYNRLDTVTSNSYGPNNLITNKGYRYNYAGPGRDVLQVSGSAPVVGMEVLQKEYGPGAVADYRIDYGLETTQATPAPDQVVVVATLPAGLSYVAGSAPTEPTITTAAGAQTLTWTIDGVLPNDPRGIVNFKAAIPDGAQPGAVFAARATATSQTISRSASAQFVIPDSGFTSLAMTTDQAEVTLDAHGAASNAWTVTMTSTDPHRSPVTDTIVILPSDGDLRGSAFSGSIALSGPIQAPDSATVYYATAEPSGIHEDPRALSNGGVGAPSAIWTTTYTADATAVRVVYGPVSFGDVWSFTIDVAVVGAAEGDVYVAGGAARATSTELRMRTSGQFATATTEPPSVPPTEPPATQPPTGGFASTGSGSLAPQALGALGVLAAGAALVIAARLRRRRR